MSGRDTNTQRRARRGRDEDGFTLLELVVGLTVFALFATGVYSMINGGLNLARNNKNRSIAANLASQEMDKIRAADFTTLPIGFIQSTQSVDGAIYTVQRETEWVATNATASPCDSAGATPSYLRVTVKVLWAQMSGVVPVESNTVLRPPVGAYDPNRGHIAVKVKDRDAEPSVAQPVRVVGSGVNTTINTTSDGCAFFGYLPAGTYTVSLSTAGFVDRQGLSSPSQSVGVFSGQVSSVGFDYDRSATLTVLLTAPDGGVIPSALPVSLFNTHILPAGSRTYSGSGPSRTITNLFPELDGYDAWAGDCQRSDPEGVDSAGGTGAYWPGASRVFEATATPGGASTVSVPLGTVTVQVRKVGAPLAGASVRAQQSSDATCTTGNNIAVGTTDAAGQLMAALPFGRWTFVVTGQTATTAWPVQNVDPRDAGANGAPGPYNVQVDVR